MRIASRSSTTNSPGCSCTAAVSPIALRDAAIAAAGERPDVGAEMDGARAGLRRASSGTRSPGDRGARPGGCRASAATGRGRPGTRAGTACAVRRRGGRGAAVVEAEDRDQVVGALARGLERRVVVDAQVASQPEKRRHTGSHGSVVMSAISPLRRAERRRSAPERAPRRRNSCRSMPEPIRTPDLDRLGTQQAKAEPRRRDPLEVVGLGEEGEHVIERPGDELLAIELVDARVVEHHVHYYLNILSAEVIDTVLDRSIALGYGRLGLLVRERMPGWPADPPRIDGETVLSRARRRVSGWRQRAGSRGSGPRVHALARDDTRAAHAVKRIIAAVPHGDVTAGSCDVSDLEAVRSFGERVHRRRNAAQRARQQRRR